jgi:hypothetical protein
MKSELLGFGKKSRHMAVDLHTKCATRFKVHKRTARERQMFPDISNMTRKFEMPKRQLVKVERSELNGVARIWSELLGFGRN